MHMNTVLTFCAINHVCEIVALIQKNLIVIENVLA